MTSPSDACVSFHGVSKKFGELVVFNELSLALPSGQTTAIVGASGSGKTTLLQMVNALERPDSGSLQVFGEPIPQHQLQQFRHRIGYAVQGAGLFPHLSARDNVTLVARLLGWSEQRIQQRFAELLQAMALPANVADRPPRELSGGQQQRLGLCRALMLSPDMLLLDEPFSAVDPVTRLGLYERFEEVQQMHAVSTLLVTHDIREARRLADVLVVLDQGRIVQSGSPDDVFADPASPYVERLIASVA
ncbi:MAG: ABC transporter ATP-binding protein [Gammaproteobacteria bacterium]|nr:ABC transporter ATP-binding protein [Gammaproteobacteria bacterium]|tara:strand:+ start:7048 stop:7788 length:741 start_codon:yes stop_codon:yes gene_type:complete